MPTLSSLLSKKAPSAAAVKLPAVKGAAPKSSALGSTSPEAVKETERMETAETSLGSELGLSSKVGTFEGGLCSKVGTFESFGYFPTSFDDDFSNLPEDRFELPLSPEFPDDDEPESMRPSLLSLVADVDVFTSEKDAPLATKRQPSNKFSGEFLNSVVAEFSDATPGAKDKSQTRFGKTLSNRSTLDEAPQRDDESPKAPTSPPPGGNYKGIQKVRKMINPLPLPKTDVDKERAAMEPVAPSDSAPEPRWTDIRKSRHRFSSAASETSISVPPGDLLDEH